MAFGQKKSTLTGADYIMAAADQAEKASVPMADDFTQLLFEMFDQSPPMFGRHAVARSHLEPWEQAPYQAIVNAAQLAHSRRDWQALLEVASIGAMAQARWARYLMAGADGHPEWTYKDEPAEI